MREINKLVRFVDFVDNALFEIERILQPEKYKAIKFIITPLRKEIEDIKEIIKNKGNYCKMLYSTDIERLKTLGFTNKQICEILGIQESYLEQYLKRRENK